MIATSLWHRTRQISTSPANMRGVADLRHYNAEFCEWGLGRPLVLLPGLAGGIDLIAPLAAKLATQFHVIAFQSRGENDCFALRRRFNLRDLGDDVREFIEWRGLERPMVVGVSFGAVVAIKFAARHPTTASGLGLLSAGMRFESGLIQRIADMVLTSYPIPGDNGFFNQFFNLLFGYRATATELDHAVRTCWQTDQSVMARRLRLLRRLNLTDELPRISLPTLVLNGAKDVLVSSVNSAELAAGVCDGHRTVVPRAGHLAPISHTIETADALQRFFETVEA